MMAFGRDEPPVQNTKSKVIVDPEPEEEIDRFDEGTFIFFK